MTANQYYVEETRTHKDIIQHVEAHHRMPDGKLIALVQICLRCGKMVSFKRNRKRCPYCQGILRTKTIVAKDLKITKRSIQKKVSVQ